MPKPKAATPQPDAAPAAEAPFVPSLCQGCTRFPDCFKLALVQQFAPGQEIGECGIYDPITPVTPAVAPEQE